MEFFRLNPLDLNRRMAPFFYWGWFRRYLGCGIWGLEKSGWFAWKSFLTSSRTSNLSSLPMSCWDYCSWWGSFWMRRHLLRGGEGRGQSTLWVFPLDVDRLVMKWAVSEHNDYFSYIKDVLWTTNRIWNKPIKSWKNKKSFICWPSSLPPSLHISSLMAWWFPSFSQRHRFH